MAYTMLPGADLAGKYGYRYYLDGYGSLYVKSAADRSIVIHKIDL